MYDDSGLGRDAIDDEDEERPSGMGWDTPHVVLDAEDEDEVLLAAAAAAVEEEEMVEGGRPREVLLAFFASWASSIARNQL